VICHLRSANWPVTCVQKGENSPLGAHCIPSSERVYV